ncbi:hypothetical protein BJ508DRAFT_321654 [Ascobolus immersus RN42]|uniref:Uncharacterized protein n=1 Tax=Ascobolus immersus RN42 TaxID=1160509 RepID=A0A3N4IXY0_ASCIM|nr:hypothetical protein BJ508DRAFT_321654 [Ascobolus immersus RN42]
MPHPITPPATPPLEFEADRGRKYHSLKPVKTTRTTQEIFKFVSNATTKRKPSQTIVVTIDKPPTATAQDSEPEASIFVKPPPGLPSYTIVTKGHPDNWKQAAGSHPNGPHYDAFCGRMEKVIRAIRTSPVTAPPGFGSQMTVEKHSSSTPPTSKNSQSQLALNLASQPADITYNTVDWSFGIDLRRRLELERVYEKWVQDLFAYTEVERVELNDKNGVDSDSGSDLITL